MAVELWRLGAVAIGVAGLAVGHFLLGFGRSCGEAHWSVAYGTSPWMKPCALLIFNIFFALVFAGIGGEYLYWTVGGLDWFYFLTHWSFFTEMLFMILLPFATHLAMQAKPNDLQPALVTFLNVLLHIQLPLSLVVTILYWVLVNDFTNLCAMGAESETCEELPDRYTLFVHGIDFVLCTVSFFGSRLPFELPNSGWLLVLFSSYYMWSVFHYLLNLGDGWPLYSALDWSNPTMALIVGAGCFVVFTLSSVLYRGLFKLRGLIDRCMNGDIIYADTAVPLPLAMVP